MYTNIAQFNCLNHKASYDNLKIHTPLPLKNKCNQLKNMMGFDNDMENNIRLDMLSDAISSPCSITRQLSSCIPGLYNHELNQSDIKDESGINRYRVNSDIDSVKSLSEPSTPEKISISSIISRDFSESDDLMSNECFHSVPIRTSNPQIYDEFFERNNNQDHGNDDDYLSIFGKSTLTYLN